MPDRQRDQESARPCCGPVDDDDSLLGMLRSFYNRRMVGWVVLTWSYGIALMALCIYAALRFFRAHATRDLILWATLFLTGVILLSLLKVFAWQLIHRMAIKGRIHRIEQSLDILAEEIRRAK